MKDKRLYLRVTEDEKYQLKLKADIAHMSISEYIITLSENKKSTRVALSGLQM